MATYEPLTREEIVRVVEGKGCARRVPMLIHHWFYPCYFRQVAPEVRDRVQRLLAAYPADARIILWRKIDMYVAPGDAPEYRWMNTPRPSGAGDVAMGEKEPMADWNQLDGILEAFPDPEYKGMFQENPADDGRYRLFHWLFTFFERHWSFRGMSNALMDYHTNPDEVHRLFGALTRFYVRMIERAKDEILADGIYITDDLGTQTGTFFSPKIFDEFFAPYYRKLVEAAHKRNLHVWFHSCGNFESFLPRLIHLGIDVVHPIQKFAMDQKRVPLEYGGKITFWAGFDVQQVIPYGTPAEVREETRCMIDAFFRKDGRLLFAAGNGFTKDTPVESLEALFDEAYAYGTEIVGRK